MPMVSSWAIAKRFLSVGIITRIHVGKMRPGGSFMVQKMAITSPYPLLLRAKGTQGLLFIYVFSAN